MIKMGHYLTIIFLLKSEKNPFAKKEVNLKIFSKLQRDLIGGAPGRPI